MSKFLGLGIAAFLIAAGTTAFADARVIYGEDDRRDLFDSRNEALMLDLARSTAILVKKDDLTEADKQFKLPTETFGESQNLCKEEPFFDQPTPGFCSGFLVGDDLFVTAGHCITDESMCAGVSMIFDYGYDHQGKDLSAVDKDDVYFCQSIVAREYAGGRDKDFAIVKLDRAVVGREALKLNRGRAINSGDGVTVIGHPSGLPTKITSGAKVRANDAAQPYFVANLDTYGGNSGSAVFNTKTGEVEGILVRGETDFVYRNSCAISNHCEEGSCRGEDVTKTSLFVQHVPAK